MSRYFNGDGTVRRTNVRGPVGGNQEYSVFGWADRRMSNTSIPETTMAASMRRTGPSPISTMKVAGTRTLAATGDRPRPVRACVLDFRLAGAKSLYGQCLLVTAILNSFCEDMLTKSMALSTFESAQGLIMSERYKWWFLCSLFPSFLTKTSRQYVSVALERLVKVLQSVNGD